MSRNPLHKEYDVKEGQKRVYARIAKNHRSAKAKAMAKKSVLGNYSELQYGKTYQPDKKSK
jgi:hypothetical protein